MAEETDTQTTTDQPQRLATTHCSPSVVTCVYCGHEYPEGTPTHKASLLTEHIKVCDKHPMRESEARIERLRNALAGLVGAETAEELDQIEVAMRLMPAPDEDKRVSLNAIHALRSELSANVQAHQPRGESAAPKTH